MDKLKPCPFCENQMKGYPDYTISFKRDKKKRLGIYHDICTLRCGKCGCTIQQAGATREKAEENVLKAWNRRTEQDEYTKGYIVGVNWAVREIAQKKCESLDDEFIKYMRKNMRGDNNEIN